MTSAFEGSSPRQHIDIKKNAQSMAYDLAAKKSELGGSRAVTSQDVRNCSGISKERRGSAPAPVVMSPTKVPEPG